jgi:GNAT superfamily N-acetyltransferase
MKIEYVQKIHGTPVLPYIIDAYVTLRKAGNIEAMDAPASGDEEAFFIQNRLKRIVGVCSFYQDETKFVVNMGYVSKEYRKKGYYAALWERLVEEARKRNIKFIMGYHKPGNKAILAFNERVGRRIKYVCSEYTVEQA